jgi:hypothetical protein
MLKSHQKYFGLKIGENIVDFDFQRSILCSKIITFDFIQITIYPQKGSKTLIITRLWKSDLLKEGYQIHIKTLKN